MNNRTLKDILEDPLIKDIAPDAISKRDLSKEEFYGYTMQEIDDKLGWKSVSPGLERLLENAERGNYYFKLYSEAECAGHPEKENCNFVFFPSDDASAGEKPFMFIIPGGGFYNVWNLTEGWPVARHFNDLGYNVFILTYQVQTEGSAVKAMDDMAKAFEIIRARRDEFRVDPDSYMTCGFSAGGYIACLWNTELGYSAHGIAKPQACFPIYPVTSYRLIDAEPLVESWMGDERDEFARSGTGVTMRESCEGCFEIPEHVDGFPKTAIFVAAEDELVDPQHSKTLADALRRAGIPCRLEIGETGGHGFGDGTGMCMEGWPKRAIEWFEAFGRG